MDNDIQYAGYLLKDTWLYNRYSRERSLTMRHRVIAKANQMYKQREALCLVAGRYEILTFNFGTSPVSTEEGVLFFV